ncbi:GNAT family N-acetyltransferase [Umezawaea tangerina]|uniref:RimJ/RimL family protein N-acetyltransferase n=1 Tax=Umezawaea tangerina TaxID=84725 RepID=A0A2T0SN21_9PSEU|nr:GNAT family protein [Umezawaea tangerina]PRY34798.1 RimJ/RimL family protein N-acetyltransferase [Umezawaea tangerina]
MTFPIGPVELTAGELLLRPPDERDAVEALAMVRDPDSMLWNPAASVVDVASARDWCKSLGDWSPGDHATFSVVDVGSGRLVGNVSLHKIDAEQLTAEMGYRVGAWARGRGVATAAVRAVTEWGFEELGLQRVQLFHAVGNVASCRVAVKCGYRDEGTLRSASVYGDGVRYDEHLHARLAGDGV